MESVLVVIDREHTQGEGTYGYKKNSQDKCRQILNSFFTIAWLGCEHFKRFVFEEVVDQVASDLKTHSCRSSGGSPFLLKAL